MAGKNPQRIPELIYHHSYSADTTPNEDIGGRHALASRGGPIVVVAGERKCIAEEVVGEKMGLWNGTRGTLAAFFEGYGGGRLWLKMMGFDRGDRVECDVLRSTIEQIMYGKEKKISAPSPYC